MIAKRILAPKGGAGFERLAGYVVNARGGVDPASWERLGAYILDAANDGHKVAWTRTTNCHNDEPGWAVKEILATQARNTRSRSDKSYHLVVSFPTGERPTREAMEDIEDRLCEAIGFGAHQRISAVHQNTENWHLHVAINKVEQGTFRNIAPFQDHFRLQKACAELEIKHGLTVEPHTLTHEQARERKGRGRAGDFEAHQGGPSFLAWITAEAAPALLAARDSGRGWQAMHEAAARFDLSIKPRGAGLVIGHRADKRLHVKASDVDRGLSLKALADALGPYQTPGAEIEGTGAGASYSRPGRGGPLYARFQRERQAAENARKQAMAELRARHVDYTRELAGWYRERVQRERALGQRGFLRRDSRQHIAEQRAKDRAERIAREAEERRAVRAAFAVPTWRGWLEAEATRGNAEAAATLSRGRAQQERTKAQSDISAANLPYKASRTRNRIRDDMER